MYKPIKVSEFLHRFKEPVELEPEQEYSLVTIRNHHRGVVLRNKTKGNLIGSKMYRIYKGQFILSGIDARNGAFGIVPDELDGAIVTNDFWCFNIDETKVKRDFFYWLTNTPLFLNACIKSSQGVTQRIRLQKKLFFDFEFRFPPIEEQENFLTKIQHADQNLKLILTENEKQQLYITQLKQAILQEAISGKLTAEWRKQNPIQKGDPDTDAVALLAKIKEEKQQLIAEGKLKKEKPLPPISSDEVPFSLPDGWVWCRLVEIAEGFEYGTSSKSLKIGKVPVLRMGNLQNGLIDLKDLVYTDNEEEIEQYKLSYGDLLFNRTNSRELVGKTSLFLDNEKMIYAGYLVRYRMIGKINFYYTNYVMNSQLHREWCNTVKSDAIGQSNINATKLRSFIFPLPPLAEQKAIVEKVDYLMNQIEELEAQIKHRKQLAEELMQTVLREAFV